MLAHGGGTGADSTLVATGDAMSFGGLLVLGAGHACVQGAPVAGLGLIGAGIAVPCWRSRRRRSAATCPSSCAPRRPA
jgi:hypothetical protein